MANLIIEEGIYGYKKLPKWLKQKYLEAVNFICQDCHKHKNEVGILEIHRIKRGISDGLYSVVPLNHLNNNVKVLCKQCHQKYNYSRKLVYK